MKKITSNILIVATVIAMLPLQGFALSEQVTQMNTISTGGSQTNVKKFSNDTDRVNYIKGSLKGVRMNNLNNSITDRDPSVKAQKVRTLTEWFHDRKKNKKEVIVTSTDSLDTIRSTITNVDTTASVKKIGANMYSVTFADGKNLDTNYFSNIDSGSVPEKLFNYSVVQPTLVSINGVVDPYLTGELLGNLWGMTKMETTNYQKGLSLQAASTTIAVIDTGVDRAHKDLSKNTWVNSKEVAGNNIDDDGNGYIDDINGYDFVNSDADPMDDHGHGTHVSGSVAGVVNGAGVFGVNSSAKVIGLKVLSAAGNGSNYNVYRAIYYAADNGIKVINMSLGGGGTPATDPICAAIDYAKTKGTITVVAAGNSNLDASTQVPAGCTNAITVGAVDSTLTKASFSNYGTKVDVAGPGVSIYSTTRGNTYGSWAGTSMASPYIAGLVSAIKTYRPAITADDIKVLFKNVTLTEPITSSVNVGRLPNMAKIFVNLGIASDSDGVVPPVTPPADTTAPITTSLPIITGITQTGATFTAAISEDGVGYSLVLPATSAAPTSATVVAANSSFAMRAGTTTTSKVSGLTAGTAYKLYFVAKDDAGNLQTAPVSVNLNTLAVPPTDLIAPINTIAPSVSQISQTSALFSAAINENGVGYYTVLPSTATAPSVDSVLSANKLFDMRAQATVNIQLAGLTAATAYTVYFVAKDTAGNLQRAVTAVNFTTLATSPGTGSGTTDTTPPVTLNLSVTGTTQTGTTLSISINENGTGYYLVLPTWSASPGTGISAPTSATIIAANNTIALKSGTIGTVRAGNLTANTSYTLWFVAKDLVGNTQATPSSVAFATLAIPVVPPTDTIPPVTSSISVTGTTQTGTTLSITINEDGTGYYTVLPATSAAPANTAVVAANKTVALKANTVATVKIDGLTANTAYKVYFVAKDSAGNLQATVSFVAVTTLAIPVVPPTDTVPPVTSSISVTGTTQTGTTLSITINEDGTGYYLVSTAAAGTAITTPTSATVVAANKAVALKTNAVATVKIDGLTVGTRYMVWFVAKDAAGNLQTTPRATEFVTLTVPTKDITPPVTVVLPTLSLINQTEATLTVATNEAGLGYYVVLAANAAAPTPTAVVAANKSIGLKAYTLSTVRITGLTANTAYKVYFVAKDAAGNLQTTVSSSTFTTLSVPSNKPNIPPTITYTAKLVAKNTYELTIVGADVDGKITRYEMYFNGNILFTTLPKVTARISGGNVTVSAKVYDNLGASATSPNVVLQYVK